MICYTVQPTVELAIPDMAAAYHAHGRDVKVSLSERGEYTTDGVPDERDSGYELIVREVTERMVEAYARRERVLRTLHKSVPRIWLESEVTEYMAGLEMSTFRRTQFPLFKPVPSDVQRELAQEADIRFGKVLSDGSEERERFVKERLKTEYEARVRAWTDALAFHRQVQDFKEKRYNTHHKSKYEERMLCLRSFLQGAKEYVNKRLLTVLESLKTPFPLVIRCKYQEDEWRLVTQIELPPELGLPRRNASVGPDGRIRISAKSDSELLRLQTETILSIVYMTAATLFSVSANVSVHKVNVWLHKSADALLAVEFDREDMSRMSMRHLRPLADYHRHRRRDNVMVDDNMIRFLPLGIRQSRSSTDSHNDMAAEPEVKYGEPGTSETGYSPGGTNWETDIETALALREALADDPVLNIMVTAADSAGQSHVRLPRKYEQLFKDLLPNPASRVNYSDS